MELQHCDAFDVWGRGTQVTVSSQTTAAPTLFPLVQCEPAGDKVTVACVAHDFFPNTVTFQWTDASGQSLTSVNYPPSEKNNKYTGVSALEVLKSDWGSRKPYNCSVTHAGGSSSVKLQKPPPPKVTLLSVPRGDTQALVCTIENLLSENLSVKWKKNEGDVTGSTDWNPKSNGLVYSAVSILNVESKDWDNDAVYTCEVTHKGTKYTEKVSKALVTVTLKQPSGKDIFSNNQAKLECVITGQDSKTVNDIKITWEIDGKIVTDSITERTNSTDGHRKISTMTRSLTEWQRVNKVRCSASRDDMTPVTQDLTVHRGDGRKPKVTVHILPEAFIEQDSSAKVTLVCLVSGPVLQDYYIAWSEDTGSRTSTYTDGINFPSQKIKDGYLVTSVYTTTKDKWKTHKFTCNVWPAGSNESMKTQDVSKATDVAPDSIQSFLSCTDGDVEEDEFSSLWSTTSSFIFLFIFSVFYSMTFSLVKMKKQ